MSKYSLLKLSQFERDIKKIKDGNVLKKIGSVLLIFLDNPFQQSLKTHRVNIPSLGSVYSSRVTGDLRIIWAFSPNNNIVIVAIRLQGHDTVYS